MSHMLEFLEAILAVGVLPALTISMVPPKIWPVLIYTDASFHWLDGLPYAVLGFYVRDTASSAEHYSMLVLPLWYYSFLTPDLATYITQCELVAAVAVFYTLPHLLRDRAIIHFIDNTGALSALVHGYASKPDLARLVNVYHVQVVGLRCMTWHEWVPSKANPGDIPTRASRAHEMSPSAAFIPMVLPPIEAIEGDVTGWIARVRNAA